MCGGGLCLTEIHKRLGRVARSDEKRKMTKGSDYSVLSVKGNAFLEVKGGKLPEKKTETDSLQ